MFGRFVFFAFFFFNDTATTEIYTLSLHDALPICSWAISARGFNSTAANKLLVLIDGRTVYSPLFSGTFWEIQDLVLDDIARIEVVRGPGATLWGANAVNGIINIVTKTAHQTKNTAVILTGGGKADLALG